MAATMSDTAKALEAAARAVETILDDAYHAGRDEPPAEHTARACILAYLRAMPDGTDIAKPGERLRIMVTLPNLPSRMIAAIEEGDGG